MRIMQLAREGSPPPRLRLPQAELSRKSNQIARGRIRRFESDMPSHAVLSEWLILMMRTAGELDHGQILRSSAEILARAANAHHAAGTRRVFATRIAPTS